MDYVQGGARKFQYFTNTGFSSRYEFCKSKTLCQARKFQFLTNTEFNSRYEVLDFFLPGIIDRFIVFSISIPHDRFTSHARESESVRPAGSRFFESVFFLIKTIGYETRFAISFGSNVKDTLLSVSVSINASTFFMNSRLSGDFSSI